MTTTAPLPAALRQRAAAVGCILAEGGGLGGYMLFDRRTGEYVLGHPGYPLTAWDDSGPFGDMLWQATDGRLQQLDDAHKGQRPVADYHFTNAADWVTAAKHSHGTLTKADLLRAIVSVPAVQMPDVLWGFHQAGLPTAILTEHLASTWSTVEYPDRLLDHRHWRTMFEHAGYTRNGHPAPKPTQPVRLWRGSTPQRRTDWSWTTDRDVAHQFGHLRKGYRPVGQLWTALVPPEYLYAENTERGEAEFIAHVPRHLIVADTAPCTCTPA